VRPTWLSRSRSVNVDGAYRPWTASVRIREAPRRGILDGAVVSCRLHFWQFDVVKGTRSDFSGGRDREFRGQDEDGDIYVEV